jgi:hypothetical protein
MSQLQSALVPDGYELIGDEYVGKILLLSEKEIEKHVETNIPSFFDTIGYNIKKVPRTTTRTVDYEYEDLGLEVTSIREYLPKNDEVDKLLAPHDKSNSRICAYMYLKGVTVTINIMFLPATRLSCPTTRVIVSSRAMPSTYDVFKSKYITFSSRTINQNDN